MTAKEYAVTMKGKSITAAYIGPLRLLQNAEMDSTYLPEVIEDPERDQVYYTGNLVKPDAASGLRPYVLIQPYTIVASRDDLCKHGLDYIMCAPEEYSTWDSFCIANDLRLFCATQNDIREYQAKQTDLDLGLEDDDDDAHWVDNSFPDLADLMDMDLPDPELPEDDPDDDWLYTD